MGESRVIQTMTHRLASIVWGCLGALPPISIVIYELKRLWNYNNCKINGKSIHRKQNLPASRHNGFRRNSVERKASEIFRHCEKNNKLVEGESIFIPIIIGRLGTVPKNLTTNLEQLGRWGWIEITQTTALLKEKRNKIDEILKTFFSWSLT